MRRPVSIALLSLVVASPAFAEAHWVEFASNEKTRAFIDPATVKQTQSTVRYWTRYEYSSDKEGWKSSVTLREMDCAKERSRILQTVVYLTDGSIQNSADMSEWLFVTPDTFLQAQFTAVC